MDLIVLDPTQDPAQDTLVSTPLRKHPLHKLPPCFRKEVDEAGICWLTFDTPNSSANVWNVDTLDELDTHIEDLHRDASIRALVIRSAKERIFIAGADLKNINELPLDEVQELLALGQDVFTHLESLRIPKIAAIHGACVGGGFEMTLACDWRIASDSEFTRIGLPETQIGLVPAWGGCTRLPRLIGVPQALDLIVSGKTLRADKAKKLGLVHHVTAQEHLHALATRLALQPTQLRHHHFHFTQVWPVPQVLRWKANRDIMSKTHGHYKAPLQAVDVITHGAARSFDHSLRLEQDAIRSLVRTPTTRRLIELMFQKEAASKKLPAALAKVSTKPVTQVAVIGAGVMGSGIAQWLATRGVHVMMCDTKPEYIAAGLTRINKLTHDGVKHGVLTRKAARDAVDRISVAHERAPLERFDMVIESAVEDMALKKRIFADLATRVSADTILATNTSALSIAELAKDLPHPERVIGFHFFNPVHRMNLVEVITLDDTTPEVAATALRFAQSLGKTPVLVKDSPGFIVNRILVPYLMESMKLAETMSDPWDIDEAMLDFGMPMGPLRLLDEIGLDIAKHVAGTLSKSFPDRMIASPLLDKMIAAGMIGKKAGKGFYLYQAGSQVSLPNPEVIKLAKHDEDAIQPSGSDIAVRLHTLMQDEALKCLDEKVTAHASDIELAMILGAGYPPFSSLFSESGNRVSSTKS
jgi:3-hydroxyacyl-CoA dehydrogenase/enoyl-CoA hydratase/3-hydroxybutyryl-CoA epimerase